MPNNFSKIKKQGGSSVEKQIFTLKNNLPLARELWKMELLGDTGAITAPGQFVDLRLESRFLRRPISVSDWEEGKLTLIYKEAGEGTRQMTRLEPGTKLDILTGLGNGFSLDRAGEEPLLVGGGVGAAPLYALAKALVQRGSRPRAVLGFNSAEDVFLVRELEALGTPVALATADGSAGKKGFVTDVLPPNASYLYACGPGPMLRALSQATDLPGEFSFEARMGCGFGACMGCTMETRSGPRRICKEGPVFERGELLW